MMDIRQRKLHRDAKARAKALGDRSGGSPGKVRVGTEQGIGIGDGSGDGSVAEQNATQFKT